MKPTKRLSVLVAHYAPLMRFALTTLVRSQRQFHVIGETGEAPIARRLFAECKPDLVVLSLTLQHGDGFGLLKDFRRMNPQARTLVVTARNDSLSVQRAFKSGVCGYVVTEDQTAEVLQALQRIAAGELYTSATVARSLLQMLADGEVEARGDDCAALSDRELQVFRLIGSGFGTSRVASELNLSIKTIETHRQRIKEKLGLTNALQLTQRAMAWHLDGLQQRHRVGRNSSRRLAS